MSKTRFRLRYGTPEKPQNTWLTAAPDLTNCETKAKLFKTADDADRFRTRTSKTFRLARNFYIEELPIAEIFV